MGDRPDEAEKVLDEIAEFGETDTGAAAWAMLGGLFLAKNKYDEAAIAYGKAVEHSKHDTLAFAYLGLGAAATMKEDLRGAKAAYRKAIGLSSPEAALAAHEALLEIEEAMRDEGVTDEMLEDE